MRFIITDEQAADRPQIVETLAAAALEIGISERILSANIARGCPGSRGNYHLDEIRAWRAANVKPRPRSRFHEPEAPRARHVLESLPDQFADCLLCPNGSRDKMTGRVTREKLDYLAVEAIWILCDLLEWLVDID